MSAKSAFLDKLPVARMAHEIGPTRCLNMFDKRIGIAELNPDAGTGLAIGEGNWSDWPFTAGEAVPESSTQQGVIWRSDDA